ncbi:MAG: TIGR01440 family protein [Butyricicoccus sp.]
MELSEIREQSAKAAEQVCEAAKRRSVTCLWSAARHEILGKIGTHSSVEVAEAVFEGIHSVLHEHGVELAAQCCEHLNRALIVERAVAEQFGLEEVNVVPQPKAGGSFGTTAYKRFDDPVAVESLKQSASAGMDIGGTLIGMHIKPVVVPLRIETKKIGEAVLLCARRRPKFVGGSRAVYNEKLL